MPRDVSNNLKNTYNLLYLFFYLTQGACPRIYKINKKNNNIKYK